jgi:Ca2+-transporting ATPase
VLAFVLAGQWLIVTFGGQMFRTTPLPWESWLGIFLFTSPVMLVGELYRLTRRLTAKK